ncbi:AAA family ATPase [Chitinophaga rhizosphaerae]|uniref:AAA family ATPase n=1 Tax=Chitinophaga rhizosphaerae TaxID=1864947 RepID=UPI000F810652|nr:AAA family ATPase [Chitinophaga rhizosphaerae]
MIKSINKIHGFRIFQDFTRSSSLSDFSKYNLFYGWNGSGKSTFSNLLQYVEEKSIPDEHLDAKFEIELADKQKLTNGASLSSNSLKLKVFNKYFVAENINFEEQGAKSILLVSKERIEEKAKLKELNKEKKSLVDRLLNAENGARDKRKVNEKFLSDIAKGIKNSFKVIDTKDTYYFNYDRNKLSAFIDRHKQQVNATSILTDADLSKVIMAVKPEVKEIIPLEFELPNSNNLIEFEARLNLVLQTNIVSNQIEQLVNDELLNRWVEEGLKLHSKIGSEVCGYCGNAIAKERINALNAHFSADYISLKTKIEDGIKFIESIKQGFHLSVPLEDHLYDEYKEGYKDAVNEFKSVLIEIDTKLKYWSDTMNTKLGNPFEILSLDTQNTTSIFTAFSSSVNKVISVLELCNSKTDNYSKILKESQEKLELHYVSEALSNNEYFRSLIEIEELDKESNEVRQQLNVIAKEILELEKVLVNAVMGAEQFNENLYKFLGRNDILLEYIADEGGYKIIRSGKKELAKHLSEGERTAIAFVYFISKLQEMEIADLQESIIVLDDPISSFDSNHLFNAAHFIKEEFFSEKDMPSKIGQLFILTHNFNFFSLINEWFEAKDLKKVFCIKNINHNGSRAAIFEDAEYVLKQFGSEYHFIFSEIKKYNESNDKSYYHTHTIANLCRQLLESFLTFKFGRKKLDKCFDEIVGFSELAKVRKFVNHYSHRADHGTSIRGYNDNLFGETEKLVPIVLELVKYVDNVHYTSMLARINGN